MRSAYEMNIPANNERVYNAAKYSKAIR